VKVLERDVSRVDNVRLCHGSDTRDRLTAPETIWGGLP
jgi:hypothetical protein